MKAVVTFVRILVGVLFIFSGLVKANDPLGLSYKMQEFFEVWNIHGFNSWTLLLSVLMNAFEIIAGFALLLGWRIRLFIWLLLALIVFFTFLTGYTYITGKPANCGCFGDCLPISSFTSFMKDVVLTILITFLLWQIKHIRPLFADKPLTVSMLIITLAGFGFQWYTLTYLPVVDCLPFKKGNNIAEKMKMPKNAVPDSTVIMFVYKKDGKEVQFTATSFPADFSSETYQFVKREDKVIRKGRNNEPPIKGFALSGDSGIDSTNHVLTQPYAVLLFMEDFTKAPKSWKKKFEDIHSAANAKNIPCFIITAQPGDAAKQLAGTSFAGVQVFKCDYKVIETAARSIPCIYLLKEGTIVDKFSGAQMQKINGLVSNLPAQAVLTPVPPAITNDSIPPAP